MAIATWNSDYLTLADPAVVVGLLAGILHPLFFASFVYDSVRASAPTIDTEVRRQILAQLADTGVGPDPTRLLTVLKTSVERTLWLPIGIALATPITVGFLLGPVPLAGLVLGCALAGFPFGLVMIAADALSANARAPSRPPGPRVARVDGLGASLGPLIKTVASVAILFAVVMGAHHLGY